MLNAKEQEKKDIQSLNLLIKTPPHINPIYKKVVMLVITIVNLKTIINGFKLVIGSNTLTVLKVAPVSFAIKKIEKQYNVTENVGINQRIFEFIFKVQELLIVFMDDIYSSPFTD